MSDFHRIKRLPPYVFEQVNRIKAAARAGGADIVDLGMGNPDLPAPKHVIDKLVETVGKPRTDRYSASKGITGLRRAQAGYYERRFGVKLNPDTQVVATLGSKEGFANMAQAITAPGDVVLVPNPSYPIHAFGFLMAGGVIRSVPAEPTPAFFPAAERAVAHSIPKPVALVVCYPSNPTAYVASLDFYRDLVAFAKKHELILLSDLAYSEVYFDEANPPPSILAGAGRHRRGGGVHLHVEDLLHGGMADRLRGRQRASARRLGAGEILSRLRRLHAGPGRRDRGSERPGRLHPRDARDLQAPPGRAGRFLRQGRLECPRRPPRRCSPGSRSRRNSALSAASNSRSFWWRRPTWRWPPASASANIGDDFVRIALVENEQRIRQAARNIRKFFDTADTTLHNVVPLIRARVGGLGRLRMDMRSRPS